MAETSAREASSRCSESRCAVVLAIQRADTPKRGAVVQIEKHPELLSAWEAAQRVDVGLYVAVASGRIKCQKPVRARVSSSDICIYICLKPYLKRTTQH